MEDKTQCILKMLINKDLYDRLSKDIETLYEPTDNYLTVMMPDGQMLTLNKEYEYPHPFPEKYAGDDPYWVSRYAKHVVDGWDAEPPETELQGAKFFCAKVRFELKWDVFLPVIAWGSR